MNALAGDAVRAGAVGVGVQGHRRGAPYAAADWVAEEVPVALEFNGISHAVMLATPLDLDDFALGFSLCEGIVDDAGQVYDIACQRDERGVTVSIDIAASAFARLKDRRRSMAGRTGCGLCGTENLQQVLRPLPALPPPPAPAARHDDPAYTAASATETHAPPRRIARSAIAAALADAARCQTLQQLTGAVHAATWCTDDGHAVLQREDVGRHNALDKLVGARARDAQRRARLAGASTAVGAATLPADGWIAVTSRASLEMVQKAVIAGAPLLVAVSAPTSLAISVAESAGLTLCGFARGDDLVAYTHPGRIAW